MIYGSLAVGLAAVLSTAFGTMLADQNRAGEGKALQVVSKNIARTLAAGLEDRSEQVDALAGAGELWRHGLASAEVQQALNTSQRSDAHSAWTGVADPQGKVKAASGGVLVGASVAERDWFKNAQSHRYVGDVHNAKLLAKYMPATDSGEPRRFVDFASPIMADGKLVGVLGKHGSWDWARYVVESMAPADAAQLHLEVFIFDRHGVAIYAPRSVALADAKMPTVTGSSTATQPVGTSPVVAQWGSAGSYLTAAAAMEPLEDGTSLGWTVVTREPSEIAFAAARRGVWIVAGLGIFGAALAAVLAWYVSGMLSHPLSAIARAARDVEDGVEGAHIPEHASNTEMARLSRALSTMTRRLMASKAELEARVQERTADLERANADLERANTELAKLARHDPLTGLLNRRAFEERMDIAIAAAKRSGKPISVLMLDADHFKRVNDNFGHDAGDEVLKRLASLLSERLREVDCVARMGGEEFAVLLPNTDEPGAMCVAQSIVHALRVADMGAAGSVTVSVGVATSQHTSDVGEKLMRCADQALYAAKKSGRNRAVNFRVIEAGGAPALVERAQA